MWIVHTSEEKMGQSNGKTLCECPIFSSTMCTLSHMASYGLFILTRQTNLISVSVGSVIECCVTETCNPIKLKACIFVGYKKK